MKLVTDPTLDGMPAEAVRLAGLGRDHVWVATVGHLIQDPAGFTAGGSHLDAESVVVAGLGCSGARSPTPRGSCAAAARGAPVTNASSHSEPRCQACGAEGFRLTAGRCDGCFVAWRECPTTTPEPHDLGEFPMTCYRCHIKADS